MLEMIASANSFFLRQVLSAARATRRAEVCATRISARKDAGAADGMVMETEFAHRLRIQQISTVEYDGSCHPLFDRGQINIGKLSPFRGDNERFGAIGRFQCRRCELCVRNWLQLTCFLHSLRVVNAYMSAFAQHGVD